MSWVTITKADSCWSFNAISMPNTASAVFSSRLPVGSSANTQAGRLTKARATATRWRSPPDSSPGLCRKRCPRPTCSSSACAGAAACRLPCPAISNGIITFSRALNSGSRWWNW